MAKNVVNKKILRKVWGAEDKLVDGIKKYKEGMKTNNTEAAALGCRKILDALVNITDAVLLEHGVRPYWGLSIRSTRRSTLRKMEMLRRGGLILVGRKDIESIYAHAKNDLQIPQEFLEKNAGDVIAKNIISKVTRTINSESKRLLAKYGGHSRSRRSQKRKPAAKSKIKQNRSG